MKKYGISKEDKELFNNAVQGVIPLKKSDKIQLPKASKSHTFKKNNLTLDIVPPDTHLDINIEKVNAETILSYASNSITKSDFRQLKRGKIPINATLDLHGENLTSVKSQLNYFFNKAQKSDYKTVLIIHGKGRKNHNGPILKNYLNNLLRQMPQVIAFHSAKAMHGGSGAIYVLLRM